ncbi:unnamed protein product, partial [Timema podura]|nr:unnamed protein product [Timema podura]
MRHRGGLSLPWTFHINYAIATFQANIPDALTNDCSKCSNMQREGTKKVIRHLYNNKQDIWKQLQAKYDPENVYLTKYGHKLEQ